MVVHSGIVSGVLIGAVGFLGLLGLRRRLFSRGRGCGSAGACGSRGYGGHHGAQHGGGHGDPAAWRARAKGYADHFLGRFFSEIKAEPEQKERITNLYERAWGGMSSLQDERRDLRDNLEQQWRSDSPDEAAVHARLDAGIESLRRFVHETASSLLEMHRMLSPEQRARINGWLDRRRGRK